MVALAIKHGLPQGVGLCRIGQTVGRCDAEDSWSRYLSIEGIYKRYEFNASIEPKILDRAVKKKLRGIVRGFELFGVFSRPSERGFRDVAQPGSALAWGARGRWFESSRPDNYQIQRGQRAR